MTSTNWHMRQLPETGGFLFFRNQRNDKNWLKVRAKGTASNRSAVGARLSVCDAGHAGSKRRLRGFREIAAGSGVFSSQPLEQHFGLDARSKYDLVVYFPTTKRKVVLRGVATAQALEVTEPKR
ncbi:MAG: ASPIC/UnbV domain-containing protein [Planctomycetota bacterium]